MRTAYIDCFHGIAGDMLLGALIAAGAPWEELKQGLAGLGLGALFELRCEQVLRGSVQATKVDVDVLPHSLGVSTLANVSERIVAASLPAKTTQRAISVFRALAEAEARVHGSTIDEVHFHEVGAVDALVDVCGCCLALELLEIDEVLASGAVLGSGTVCAAHGELPVPAPATLYLVEGMPIRRLNTNLELTTPTGAALLRSLSSRFGPLTGLNLERCGFGAGTANPTGRVNAVRIWLGTQVEPTGDADHVLVLETQIDDMRAELVAVAMDRCLEAGALDALATPCLMKKGRPGMLLTVLTPLHLRERVEEVLFTETTTFGIRYRRSPRTILVRNHEHVDIDGQQIEVKLGWLRGEVVQATPELTSVQSAARALDQPVRQLYDRAAAAALAYTDCSRRNRSS